MFCSAKGLNWKFITLRGTNVIYHPTGQTTQLATKNVSNTRPTLQPPTAIMSANQDKSHSKEARIQQAVKDLQLDRFPALAYDYGSASAGIGRQRLHRRSQGFVPDPQPAPEVHDELNEGLAYVQLMCECAADRFLRGGDCDEDLVRSKAASARSRSRLIVN